MTRRDDGHMSGDHGFEPISVIAARVVRKMEMVRAVALGCTEAVAEIAAEQYRRDTERLAAEINRLQANEYRPPETLPSVPWSGTGDHASDARLAGGCGEYMTGQSEERNRETGGPGMGRGTADRGGTEESGPGGVSALLGSAPGERASQ